MIPITHVPVTEVAKRIFRVGPLETGHTSAPTSPYIIVGKDRTLIAEPGQDGQVTGIIEALGVLDVPVNKVEYVWASHIHLYHIQGLSVLMPEVPKAKFLAHPRGAPHIIEPTRLMESTRGIWNVEETPEERGTKCYAPYRAIPAVKVQTVQDNEIIDLGGKKLQVIWAPGHAPHHMGLFDLESHALFAGDMGHRPGPGRVRARHDIRPPLFELDLFVQTAQRFLDLKPSVYLGFSEGGAGHEPEQTLRWEIDDMVAIEKICREGMQQKVSFAEIGRRVDAYELSVFGIPRPARGTASVAEGGGQRMLVGMLAFVKRKHPELQMPADASPRSAMVGA